MPRRVWHRGSLDAALAQLTKTHGWQAKIRRSPYARENCTWPCAARMIPAHGARSAAMRSALGRRVDAARRMASAAGQTRQALADYRRSLGYGPDDHEVVACSWPRPTASSISPNAQLLALQNVAENFSPNEVPQQVLYLEGLALTALALDEATRSLTQAVRRDRPSAEMLYRLAEAQMLSGNAGAANVTLHEALALDPNHAGSKAMSARMALVPTSDRAAMR